MLHVAQNPRIRPSKCRQYAAGSHWICATSRDPGSKVTCQRRRATHPERSTHCKVRSPISHGGGLKKRHANAGTNVRADAFRRAGGWNSGMELFHKALQMRLRNLRILVQSMSRRAWAVRILFALSLLYGAVLFVSVLGPDVDADVTASSGSERENDHGNGSRKSHSHRGHSVDDAEFLEGEAALRPIEAAGWTYSELEAIDLDGDDDTARILGGGRGEEVRASSFARETLEQLQKLVRVIVSLNYERTHFPEGQDDPDRSAPHSYDGVPYDTNLSFTMHLLVPESEMNCRKNGMYVCTHLYFIRCVLLGLFPKVRIFSSLEEIEMVLESQDVILLFEREKSESVTSRETLREAKDKGARLGVSWGLFFMGSAFAFDAATSNFEFDLTLHIPTDAPVELRAQDPKRPAEAHLRVPVGPSTPAQCIPEWTPDLMLSEDKGFCRCSYHIRRSSARDVRFTYFFDETHDEQVLIADRLRRRSRDEQSYLAFGTYALGEDAGDSGCDRRYGARMSHLDIVSIEGTTFEDQEAFELGRRADALRLLWLHSSYPHCPPMNMLGRSGFCDAQKCRSDPKYFYHAALQHSMFTVIPCTANSFLHREQLLFDAMMLASIPVMQLCDGYSEKHPWLSWNSTTFSHSDELVDYVTGVFGDPEQLNILQRRSSRVWQENYSTLSKFVQATVQTAQQNVMERVPLH
ncbi:hypothetical protein FVE85_7472 [Porphyridium purpureum]|uniref:Exostosin GT47 domain-containing protein n=1 Tax=Porphyridium purpureum TaxID=35688 RepID=A0A5J4ZB58_PORPP|nr:hypothetical protein FVE85_7472 [Porphyridium purpureum]|eukprot:POR0958..scf295_1